MTTVEGLFGLRLTLDDGLVVIRADNSKGKSTTLMAIVYALGLEGMLSPSHQVPLQFALTTRLEDDAGKELNVLESEVFLQIENSDNKVITVQRSIKHPSRNSNLVSVYEGPYLTNPEQYKRVDYFVRMGGAAQRERGFHTFLAGFLGWDLPAVTRFDGGESPLYLECVFPLMIVEQKHGWSGIQARMPTYLGIREIAKRATEFLLDLEAYERAITRQKLEEEAEQLKQLWHRKLEAIEQTATSFNGVIRGLPVHPTSQWPPSVPPVSTMFVGPKLLPLTDAIRYCKERLEVLESSEIPTVEQVSADLESKLHETEASLREAEVLSTQLFREVQLELEQVNALSVRQAALRVDLQNYKDVERLRAMGSELQMRVNEGHCPTCDQPIADALLPQIDALETMSLSENISFIEAQLQTFEGMETDAKDALHGKELKLQALRNSVDSLRKDIRVTRETLVSDGRLPSAAAITERIQVQNRKEELTGFENTVQKRLAEFQALSDDWRRVQNALADLKDELTESDRAKLKALQTSVISQLQQYKFSSLKPETISISDQTYRPNHEGFDLGINLSASDTVRLIWAYLFGAIEISRIHHTNHLGFLLLDEPRQQQTALVSFSEFAKRAATSSDFDEQIIFATSEDASQLKSSLDGAKYQYLSFEGKMIKKIENPGTSN